MAIWTAEIKELEILYGSLKDHLPDLEKELNQLIKSDDPNVLMLYSRRCLEVIITDLCENELKRPRKTEPLQGIIDKLNKEEKVPSHIIASMYSLNSLSTFGTHPKDFDPEQVKPVLNNLSTVLKWYLKYNASKTVSKIKPEEEKFESNQSAASTEVIHKQKKWLMMLVSGIFLVVVAVVAFGVFKIIEGKEQVGNLSNLEKSLAVLPFENLSSDNDKAWFSDGITDVIITQLSKISDLRVLGRISTLRYKGNKGGKSLTEIGKELGVNYIIEGTVQLQENKMRINVQLIRTINEGHIWSNLYDREWKDIFDVQSDIAQRIAEGLKTVLTPEEKGKIEKSQTENLEAYNLYLQGRYFWDRRDKDDQLKSVECFEKAIAADSNYALAYAGLADAYFILAYNGWSPRVEGYAKAKKYALRALEIDKNLAEAHSSLGWLYCWSEWKWEEARKEFKLATELNPNYANAHQAYSEFLDIIRHNTEARIQINMALKLDPLNGAMNSVSFHNYFDEGNLEKYFEGIRRIIEKDPGNPGPYWGYFYGYLKLGEDIKAVEALLKGMPADTLKIREIYNISGINGILNWLIKLEFSQSEPDLYNIATLYASMGKKEEALSYLEKAMKENSNQLPLINNDPPFDKLRSEPRFQALIKKMGLSEYQKVH